MSAGLLLIDGYNLLHAAGMAQSEYRPGDLLRCRTRLLRFLFDRLSAAEVRGATIVFDARDPPPDRPTQVVVSGLKVLFANPGGDADVLIQNWLARHPAPRRVTLVSSDRVLQRAARSCGSKFIGSEDFVHELERRSRAQLPKSGRRAGQSDGDKPGAAASAAQTAYWLKVFGDIPLDQDDGEEQLPFPAAQPPAEQIKSETPPKRKSGGSRKSRTQYEPQPDNIPARDQLDYWMKVFASPAAAELPAAAADELRLADLENWLKEFQATGELPPNNRRHP